MNTTMTNDERALKARRFATREFTTELEVREQGTSGRLVVGRAAPFNDPTEITDTFGTFIEQFKPGAFARTITERAGRVPILANHDTKSFPIGRAQRLYEDAAGLQLEARLSETTAGTDALVLVREGTVTGLSVGFRVVRDQWNADYTDRQIFEAALSEISLTHRPAYANAQIAGVRSLVTVLAELDELAGIRSGAHGPGLPISLADRGLELLEIK